MKDFDLRKYLAEGRLLKESLGSDPKYYVKYTTLDGKEVKSELMSKREAIYKERDLVDSGVKKSSVYKFFKNIDLNGKPYIIDTELDKEIDYRKDEKGRPIDENKLYENEYFDAYHEAGDKLENHPNYNKLVSILKDKGFEPDGTPYSDGTGRRDVHGVWDVFKSYTTEPGARGTTLTKANAKDINDALRQAGIEDIEATPSNSYSFRLKVNNLDEGRMKDPSGSIKMGKYPQVSSDTPVPMNVKYLTTNGEKLTMKVQAKNRKEAVDAVKSKDSNFKAEIKTDFVYDKDGNKLLKEDVSPKFKADDFVQPIEGVTYYSLDKPRGTISSKYVGQILDVYVNKPENIEMKDGEYIYAVDKLNHKGRNAMSFDFKESDLESISDPTDYIRSLTPYKRRN